MNDLTQWGLTPYFSNQITATDARAFITGRVINEEKGGYKLVTTSGVRHASLSGRFSFRCRDATDYPAVGDWVLAFGEDTLLIDRVLDRRSTFGRRKAGGDGIQQVLAANLDLVLIVSSLNADMNPRRLERFMALATGGGIEPVIVCSKADLASTEEVAAQIGRLAPLTPVGSGRQCHVLSVSAVTGYNMHQLADLIPPGRTAALVGSSGVGKSTILNALMAAALQDVQAIRTGDDKGRHTTTSRSMFLLPNGGILIDTPGIREVGMTDDDEGIRSLFVDLDELAAKCRFSNCGHTNEPGCALLLASQEGTIDAERIRSWQKLKREQAHQEAVRDKRLAANSKRRHKSIAKAMRSFRDKRGTKG